MSLDSYFVFSFYYFRFFPEKSNQNNHFMYVLEYIFVSVYFVYILSTNYKLKKTAQTY